MFRFPVDPSRRDAWIRAIRREHWKPNEYSMVCQLHFILKKPSLFPNNPDYVPSVFNFNTNSTTCCEEKVDRFRRLQERRKRQAQLTEQEVNEEIDEECNEVEDMDVSEPQVIVSPPSPATTTPQQTQESETLHEKVLHLEDSLKETNEKLSNLEGLLAQANAIISSTEIRLKEATDKLHKSEEEKMLLAQKLEQTGLESLDKIRELEEEKIYLIQQLHQFSSIAAKIKNDDKQTRFYTGLPTYDVFVLLLTHLSPLITKEKSLGSGLTLANELLVTLIKISRASTNEQIGYMFEIHESKVTKIFHRWIDSMFQGLQCLVVWPDKEMITSNMPSCFKPRYAKTVCIIDCSEVFIQRPTSLTARAQTFSNYKSHNTIKFLVAITPTGAISFISQCWGGCVSDRHLTANSGLLKHLKHGDLILADRGFDIADDLALLGASISIPPFTKGKPQLSQREIEFSRQLSSIRIHVERAIGRMKNYKILHTTLPISLIKREHETEFAAIDKIVFVCAALCNLHPPLVTLHPPLVRLYKIDVNN